MRIIRNPSFLWSLLLLLIAGSALAWKKRDAIRVGRQKAFVSAARQGDLTKLRLLLFLGADVNGSVKFTREELVPPQTDDMRADQEYQARTAPTALTASAVGGQKQAIEFLLEHGADVNKSQDGAPLNFAIAFGHKEICELLLVKGADISGYSGINLGDSPGGLELAVYLGQSEIVDLLLSKGAGKLSNAPGALHMAVVTENVELLAKLLSNGIVPRKYESPDIAYSLFWWAREKGNPEILKLLRPYEPTQQESASKAAKIQ